MFARRVSRSFVLSVLRISTRCTAALFFGFADVYGDALQHKSHDSSFESRTRSHLGAQDSYTHGLFLCDVLTHFLLLGCADAYGDALHHKSHKSSKSSKMKSSTVGTRSSSAHKPSSKISTSNAGNEEKVHMRARTAGRGHACALRFACHPYCTRSCVRTGVQTPSGVDCRSFIESPRWPV